MERKGEIKKQHFEIKRNCSKIKRWKEQVDRNDKMVSTEEVTIKKVPKEKYDPQIS